MVNLAGFVLLGLLSVALSSCPNHCNKNGVCDKYGRCTCDEGYQGADCSEKICPFGHAWSDVATATDVAHADAECSNRGICNRKNGKCKCMSGFSGSSCERLDCEDQCSNKGICYSMRDFASRTRNEMSQKFTYTSRWDSDKIKGCQCDYPATGYDCSQTLCPNGDDPLTTGQVNEVQLIHCASTIGSFVLNYDGVPSTAIPFTANAAMVRAALLSIPQITDVKVTFSQALGTVCQIKNNVISVEFTQQFGPLNPLVPIMDAAFDASGGLVEISADGKTTFADVSGTQFTSIKGTKEAEVCANRGLCDMQSGVCSCFDTNGDVYASSDGYGIAGLRGDCGFVLSSTDSKGVATCPGLIQCSGHGVCEDSTFQCHCSEGWYGGDCSLMACPQGRTWFAYPTADESAHLDYDTCSNMGSCDTRTGRCQCREGFYGEACQYMACGGPTDNVCNGHGRCMTMAELALWADDNGDATEYLYGSDPNNFATWDYDRVHGCRCDPGYSGYDCSLVDCPRGDDQGTYKDASEVQIVQCIADRGNFTLSFRQQKTARLQYDITAAGLAAELNKLSTVKNVEVYFAKDGPPPDGILNFIMPQREKYPDYPFPGHYDNGVFVYVPPGLPNTGIPTKTPTAKPTTVPSTPPTAVPTTGISNSGFCDTTGTQIAIIAFQYNHGDLPALIPDTVNLADYVHYNGEPHSGVINVFTDGATIHSLRSVRGTTETDVCNNRGLCDTSTGMCRCFETWTSGDGKRQGGPGATADCGYRNDQLFTNF